MIGRKRNRRKIADRYEVAEPAESGGEVWPAYVDVLASAFAFILLAFLATLTKETKAREEVEQRIGRDILGQSLRHKILNYRNFSFLNRYQIMTACICKLPN